MIKLTIHFATFNISLGVVLHLNSLFLYYSLIMKSSIGWFYFLCKVIFFSFEDVSLFKILLQIFTLAGRETILHFEIKSYHFSNRVASRNELFFFILHFFFHTTKYAVSGNYPSSWGRAPQLFLWPSYQTSVNESPSKENSGYVPAIIVFSLFFMRKFVMRIFIHEI